LLSELSCLITGAEAVGTGAKISPVSKVSDVREQAATELINATPITGKRNFLKVMTNVTSNVFSRKQGQDYLKKAFLFYAG
jgi:hypothetical protein